jgi:hypothetical protein
MSPKTITTYIAGLNYFHKLRGYNDISNEFIISKLLEGCHRNRVTFDCRAPLTLPNLAVICESLPQVCFNSYESKLFTSLFTLAYFGLFRVSELVASYKGQETGPLRNSDVSFINSDYVIISLRNFKTNQRGKLITLKIPKETGAICPVRALLDYVLHKPQNQKFFFCHQDGVPVTKTQFCAVLKKCVQGCQLSNSFKSHSFRIGRASDLAAQGYSAEVIMKLGRWTSSCYKLYIRP